MLYILGLITLIVWEAYWTYKACWLAAKKDHKGLFLFFLIFNLLGIPEIIYLRRYQNKEDEPFKD